MRDEFVLRFQSDDCCTLAVLALKACSLGLNLAVAESVIFTELCWTPAELEQACNGPQSEMLGCSWAAIKLVTNVKIPSFQECHVFTPGNGLDGV